MSLSFPASPTTGQIYQGWVWDGSKWASQQGTLGSGNRVLLLSSTVAAAVANIPLFYNFTNAYDDYVLTWRDVLFDAAVNYFGAQISWDGATWDAGTYTFATIAFVSTNASAGIGGTANYLVFAFGSVTGAFQLNGEVKFSSPYTTDRTKTFYADGSSQITTGLARHATAATYTVTPAGLQAIKGLRLIGSSGNFTRGTFNLYGIQK